MPALNRCATCLRFRFSGMSHQMSNGSAGYCTLVGFRRLTAIVSIDHGCGEHEAIPGWRPDLEDLRLSRLAAFQGAMIGLAVGDALGFPAEFRSRAQILAAYPPAGLVDFVALHDRAWPARPMILGKRHPPGTVSDDTQMAVAVGEALLEAEVLDDVMAKMADRFVSWSRADDNDRSPGGTCMAGCAKLADGVPWREAGVPDSKGCGSAMRVAPIGLRHWRDRARLLEVARASSLLTHGHDAAIEGSAAAALLVALALEKRTPAQMHEAVVAECAPRSPDLAARLAQVPALLDADPAVALSKDGLGEGWVAEEAVASALWCFWRSPDDFERTVLTGANTDGDSDSIACIAGGISGAFNGIAAIPARWREGVEGSAALLDLGARLWDAAARDG